VRARIVAVSVAGAVALVAATTVAAAERPQLTASTAEFPDRAFVLTTPKPVLLGQSDVQIRENGRVVPNHAVIPAGQAATRTFGTVLVIDSTLTMRGRPIKDAMAAARAFAKRRNPQQQLAVVTFNRETKVLLPFTTSQAAIDSALRATPTLACCTPLYDAVNRAIALVEDAEISAGSVIVLSDGANTGSQTSPGEVAARARNSQVRIFTVGLRSPAFREPVLVGLARDTGGSYAEAASSADLQRIFDQLGAKLASEYLLRYRSQAGPGENVVVAVKVAGFPRATRTTYRSPEIPLTPVEPYHRSSLDRFLSSPLSGLALAVFVGLVVAITIRAVLRRRDATVRSRVGQFVGSDPAVPATGAVTPEHERFVTRTLTAVDRALVRLSWWERFKTEIAIGEYPVQPVPLLLGTIALTLLVAFILGNAFLPMYALFAIGVPFIVRSTVKRTLTRKREKFAEQLPDNLLVMAASLRAGHSFVGALSAVVEEADEPARSELRRAVSDEQLGVPIERALLDVAERMKNGDLEQVALVASLQRETGGNTAAVLDTVVDTVRERFELRRLVRTLTAQGRMTRWILIGLPIGVGVIATLINPYYMRPLFTTSAGQVMLAAVIAMMILGSVIIKRMLEIEL
jgi:tight adherence protein B